MIKEEGKREKSKVGKCHEEHRRGLPAPRAQPWLTEGRSEAATAAQGGRAAAAQTEKTPALGRWTFCSSLWGSLGPFYGGF